MKNTMKKMNPLFRTKINYDKNLANSKFLRILDLLMRNNLLNKTKMNYETKVEIFTKVADVELLSKTIGISTESVIEFVCGDDNTFNSWYNLYLQK